MVMCQQVATCEFPHLSQDHYNIHNTLYISRLDAVSGLRDRTEIYNIPSTHHYLDERTFLH